MPGRAAVVAILVALTAAVAPVVPARSAEPVPKVAIIVGPAGTVTPRYRALAEEASRIARDAGAQVVEVYSPNATWSAVRRAVEGASIVVYLGHGNGWPSRYRDSPYPRTQNGFGLNPVAGGSDSTHQYFGEAYVDGLHLARNAVVVLSHLCYASGNTEPGLPEGTRADSIARVDNYAAGFIRAGARAVVAEGHLAPAYYVGRLLVGRSTIERIWDAAPSAHGNTFTVSSRRSGGFTERLDPDHPDGGFYRSLVSRGVTAADVRAGGRGAAGAAAVVVPPEPTLAGRGIAFGVLTLRARPVGGTPTRLLLPLPKEQVALVPKRVEVAVRWDPILLDVDVGPGPEGPPAAPGSLNGIEAPTTAPSATLSPTATPTAAPTATPTAAPTATPTAAPTTTSDPAPTTMPSAAPGGSAGPPTVDPDASPPSPPLPSPEPPDVAFVVPEELGTVVAPVTAARNGRGLVVGVSYPAVPGLYRLVATLHAPGGVAYDRSTQELLTPVLVRVVGRIAEAFGVPPSLAIPAGSVTELPVRIVNPGSVPWDSTVVLSPTVVNGQAGLPYRTTTLPARLVATWVSAEGQPVPKASDAALEPAVAQPGGSAVVRLPLRAPDNPGDYILVVDVLSPRWGALSATGGTPALVRVQVIAADTGPLPGASRFRVPAAGD